MESRTEARGEETSVYRLSLPNVWALPEALARLRAPLMEQRAGREALEPAFGREATASPARRRTAVVSTFLARLELAQ